MHTARCLIAGALIGGATSVFAVLGAGSAGALALSPVPDGVRVDLSPADTQWVHQSGFGHTVAMFPHPSAPSFGSSLDSAAALASQYPTGRVIFTVYGPLETPSGSMLAVQ